MAPAHEPALGVQIAPRHPTGLTIRNPVMIASGTFGWDGYGSGLEESSTISGMTDIQRLGAVVVKTVTMLPLVGNPEPKWYPTSWREAVKRGETVLLNSIGLTNPGLELALKDQAPVWAGWEVPVILSIAGTSVEEFGCMASIAEGTPGVAGLELNLSCPNIQNGASFALSPEATLETVRRVTSNTSLPVIAKLAPNVPSIAPIARAAEEGGADAITVCNTIPAMAIDVETRRPVLGSGAGGISGKGLHPVAVALVYQAVQVVQIPVIGVGGVFNGPEAIEFLLAGATAVQVGSANLVNFSAPLQVLDGITDYMVEHGMDDVHELIGAVQMPVLV